MKENESRMHVHKDQRLSTIELIQYSSSLKFKYNNGQLRVIILLKIKFDIIKSTSFRLYIKELPYQNYHIRSNNNLVLED